MTNTIPVLWTNDDIHYGKATELRRQLEFLDRHAIPGVFFVIPRQSGLDLDQDPELLGVIEKARGRGHEFYQHGFEHHAFECGIPDLGMMEVDPDARRLFDDQREKVEKMHTLEALVEMLENGQRIWRRAFGENSPGFRPGWGAFCGNFYKALTILGYQWVSSRLPSITSFVRTVRYDAPSDFRDGIPTHPHFLAQGIWEYPIGGDYGWRAPNTPAHIDAAVELAREEFAVYTERGHPMLLVSHFHALEYPGVVPGVATTPHPQGTGYAINERVVSELLKSGKAEFTGMQSLTKRYQKT